MNKRGQVFLMAAVIIAGLVLGASKVANTAKATDDAGAFYDRANEVKEETDTVLDYGVINPGAFGSSFDEGDVVNFLSSYNEYISGEEVLFIWGDASGSNYHSIHYDTSPVIGLVSLSTGIGTPVTVPISITTGTKADVIIGATTITVTIRGINYEFKVRDGEKFYFVLIKDKNGEKYVAKK